MRRHFYSIALVVSLAGCNPSPPPLGPTLPLIVEPAAATPEPEEEDTTVETTPEPTPEPSVEVTAKLDAPATPDPPKLAFGKKPVLSAAGRALILEFETGGQAWYSRRPFPEAPDARISGITVGIGYDLHYSGTRDVIISDWRALGQRNATRLADVRPYFGPSARSHLSQVSDIEVKWNFAIDVFESVDVVKTWAACKRAFPGFEDLRPNAQAAVASLVFNRGSAMNGANRSEMRAARDAAENRDYLEMARQFRKMVRVWKGTSIEAGMTRRRFAEARLIETP